MQEEDIQYYNMYKGLQRPVVFKLFKGKYIYWAASSFVASMVFGGLFAAIISNVVGIITFFGVGALGIAYTLNRQNNVGLHNKKTITGIILIKPKHKLKRKTHE